jgi:glycogen phosphorylase
VGYGIYYEYGLFEQQIKEGKQHECPDNWLKYANPWVVTRKEHTTSVRLYGRVENRVDAQGNFSPTWVDTHTIMGVPHDIPIVGYGTKTVNFLRLWESRAGSEFDFNTFNSGGYVDAVQEKIRGETITKVLYPNDSSEQGKELRLVQQYFFVACSLQDIIRRFKKQERWQWSDLPAHAVLQLNDTHPAVAVAELMRILVDEEDLAWDMAWGICQKIFNYTNHTLLPEALERWPLPIFGRVLPRHLQIIFEINRRFLEQVAAKWPGDNGKLAALSIIEEGSPQSVRMAHLATIASTHVNGVAALHTELLKKHLFADFNALFPGKIQNKTNGITPRRWLRSCNPALAGLIDETLGEGWARDLDKLRGLEKYASDPAFQKRFAKIKRDNKVALAAVIQQRCGVEVSPDALFDVQVKRLHEYKRQHLNLLYILSLYQEILDNPALDITPRVFVFGAKAAPGYYMAKKIIHAINAVGDTINRDPRVKGRIKVAYIPNYSVSLAEKIIPAADISQQISTAGKEASGTGNMKLSLNGALTLGTLDGANVEIMEEVGKENIFIFGMTVDEVNALGARGYNPYEYYNGNPALKRALDALASGQFTPGDPHALQPLVNNLLQGGDPYMVLADFAAYQAAQRKIDAAYRNQKEWQRMAILNTARMGTFSSDRTIRQYAEEIWKIKPVPTV